MVFYALVFDALHPISFLPINSRSSSSVNRHALPLPVSTTPRLSANLTMPDAGMLISGFVAASTHKHLIPWEGDGIADPQFT